MISLSDRHKLALDEAAKLIGQALRTRFNERTIICLGRTSPAVTEFLELHGGARVVQLPTESVQKESISEELNNLQHILKDPPRQFAKALREIDPNSEGSIYAGSFVEEGACLGRPIIGARKAGWFKSEEKEQQIAWTDGQAELQQYWIASSSIDALESICRDLSADVVLSGAPKEGLALGSSHTFALPSANKCLSSKSKNILSRLVEECRGVRVSRRSIGRPVTYYGYIAQGHHLAFGPVEALAFWNRHSYQIEAVGILTPCPDQEASLQSHPAVEGTLRRLSESCGYSGAFCMDGSINQGSLVVHEVNPRVCAGFKLLNKHIDGVLPANLIDLALRESLVEDTPYLFECLDVIFSEIFCQSNLALWSDIALEQELLDVIPNFPIAEDISHWRDEVVKRFSDKDLVPLASAHGPLGEYLSR